MQQLPRGLIKDKARKFLEKKLALLRSGDQLPPVRELMKISGIGRIRIDSILEEFESQGWIKRYPGKGIFRTETVDSPVLVPYIDLVTCGLSLSLKAENSFFSEFIAVFSSEVSLRHQGIRLHDIPVSESASDYEIFFSRPDVKACVLIGLHSPVLTDIFDKHEVAWVSLFPNTIYNLKRTIVPSDDVVKLQLEHLWSLGHQKIAYLHGVNEQAPSRSLSLRREAYYRLMAEKGLRVYPEWVQYITYRDVDVELACQNVFSAEVKPTAIIVPDPILTSVYRFVERHGMCVGKDISIVANDDLAITRNLSPAVTTVHMPMDVLVKRTLDTLQDVIYGRQVPDVYQLPVKLIVRESTASVH